MDAWIETLLAFVAANAAWAPFAAALFAAAETTAFLSPFIPSTAILIGVGGLVATGALDFMPIWIGALVGALAGSSFSWWLGATYHEQILGLWPINKVPDLVERGRAAFARWGAAAIIIGHFVGPLRPVAFLFAGMSGMSFWRFQAFNVVGAAAWAFAVPKSGEIGGNLIGALWSAITGS